MRYLVLPNPEAPDYDAAVLRELHRYARAHLDAARVRLHRARQLDGYNPGAVMLCRVMLATRERECELWAAELAALESRARAADVSLP